VAEGLLVYLVEIREGPHEIVLVADFGVQEILLDKVDVDVE